jgi:starch phosphorylase
MNELSTLAAPPAGKPGDSPSLAAELRAAILDKLTYAVGKDAPHARDHDWFVAVALAVRDRIVLRWMETTRRVYQDGRKRVYYLSLEYLIGRMLFDAMGNLGLVDAVREALSGLAVDLDRLRSLEPDPALGNGGLGRLAACFMESMATVGVAAHGYGIRYEHGIFKQSIRDGWQQERPEDWLDFGNPWEFERPEVAYPIGFGGTVDAVTDAGGDTHYIWHPAESVEALAYDTPIPGWRGHHVNTLRLWRARATDPLRLEEFNRGDHVGALADRVRLEAISRILYPGDTSAAGQELRLRQEYFFVAASLQDLLRRHLNQHGDLQSLPDHACIQLNDTHPAIAVAEMMRVLVDIHAMSWEEAWRVTTRTFNYTNHTLLPEAIETWQVALVERLLPRHMQIIYMINAQHLDELRLDHRANETLLKSVSLIEENHTRRVRMGHLAFLGSRRVNGVSALHTELLKQTVFHDFHTLYPDRIVNKTNGITFRRWLFQANPGLTRLIVEAVGPAVLDDPEALRGLEPLADDPAFRARFAGVRKTNKEALAQLVMERMGIRIDPAALFDVQIKRIHEYKRQLLNVLDTIAIYQDMRAHPTRDWSPRVKIFAGKAASSYQQAKLIIKLANDVAKRVNHDPTLAGRLKVVFIPNYNVSLAEAIIPASDLSEQISTAGMEASGTGNMKLALNGALTIGTLDGANVEIRDRVGDDNIFIFGLTAEEVAQRRREGIDATETIAASPILAEVLDAIESGVFSPDDRMRYHGLVDNLRHHDWFMVTADFESYHAMQREVGARWRQPGEWWRRAILNTARVGWFSSDRAITEYATDIWNVPARAG